MLLRYPVEPRNQMCVEDYGFSSFARNIRKNQSSKFSQKLLDHDKNQQEMPLKLLQRNQFKKLQR